MKEIHDQKIMILRMMTGGDEQNKIDAPSQFLGRHHERCLSSTSRPTAVSEWLMEDRLHRSMETVSYLNQMSKLTHEEKNI